MSVVKGDRPPTYYDPFHFVNSSVNQQPNCNLSTSRVFLSTASGIRRSRRREQLAPRDQPRLRRKRSCASRDVRGGMADFIVNIEHLTDDQLCFFVGFDWTKEMSSRCTGTPGTMKHSLSRTNLPK
jgi:hypothetical protein